MKLLEQIFYLFLIGFLIGPVFDGFHTFSGTTRYSNAWFLKMAWWTPLIFGGAVVGMGLFVRVFDYLSNRKNRKHSLNNIVFGIVLFGVMYFSSGFVQSVFLKYITLATGCLTAWFLFDKTWQGIVEGIIIGTFGTIVEIIMIKQGVFSYNISDAFGIPLWLSLLYFIASITLGNLGRFLNDSVSAKEYFPPKADKS